MRKINRFILISHFYISLCIPFLPIFHHKILFDSVVEISGSRRFHWTLIEMAGVQQEPQGFGIEVGWTNPCKTPVIAGIFVTPSVVAVRTAWAV